ncbi:HAD-IA family hydrolase [Virgibacillus halophilus]|uniref:HAD-IA family hydrolase n=2 Tax=Tigheibacillus halophilus TaxID=361280 RepID=A0ABU5CBF3_9BACI|nr:HAD-IA family hydrolase [Virgibacillus halophilus]
MWANFADPGEDFARLREIAPAYRLKVWQEALAAQQCQQAGLGKELAAMFPEQRKKCPFLFEDTVDVLKSLKEDDFELLLLTNGSPDLQNTKLSLSPVLKEYLDDIIVSGAFGIGKPDPSIFTHALEVLAVEASEVLMVGDNVKTDILGAERSGISSVLVKRHENNASGIHATYEIKNLSELLPLVQRLR